METGNNLYKEVRREKTLPTIFIYTHKWPKYGHLVLNSYCKIQKRHLLRIGRNTACLRGWCFLSVQKIKWAAPSFIKGLPESAPVRHGLPRKGNLLDPAHSSGADRLCRFLTRSLQLFFGLRFHIFIGDVYKRQGYSRGNPYSVRRICKCCNSSGIICTG